MKTPGKKILDAINPGNWAKAGVKEAGEQVRAVVDETTYSSEEQAADTTTRQQNDMQSDSWLSKNVRPIAFLHFLVLFDLLIFTAIDVEPWAQDVIKTAFFSILMWYFGERAILKITREVKRARS